AEGGDEQRCEVRSDHVLQALAGPVDVGVQTGKVDGDQIEPPFPLRQACEIHPIMYIGPRARPARSLTEGIGSPRRAATLPRSVHPAGRPRPPATPLRADGDLVPPAAGRADLAALRRHRLAPRR